MAVTHGFSDSKLHRGSNQPRGKFTGKFSLAPRGGAAAATHPGNAVVLRVLLLQAILLQRFGHREVRRVRGRQQDGLVGDIWS